MSSDQQVPIHALDEKSFMKRLMKRPGLYVGGNYLNLILTFADGFFYGNKTINDEPVWNQNYEMQYWLLHRHGAALHTNSFTGKFLFYRCFGTRDIAVGKYAELLHAEIPSCDFPESMHQREHSVAGELIHDLMFESDQELTQQDIQTALLEAIEELLLQQSEIYNEVRILIHKESLYTQFRFVYHTAKGWREDKAICGRAENHALLLRVHSLIQYASYDDLNHMTLRPGVYFHIFGKDGPRWESPIAMEVEIKDDETLWHQYQKWKTRFTASY